MCGLGNTNSSVNYTDWSTYTGFEYAFYPAVGASLLIYKSGIQRGTLGTYAASDRLKVAVESGAVKYYKNGKLGHFILHGRGSDFRRDDIKCCHTRIGELCFAGCAGLVASDYE
jgi:hypothetical protein